MTPGLPEIDRLLLDAESAATRARLALHAIEDSNLDRATRSDAFDAFVEATRDLFQSAELLHAGTTFASLVS